MKKLFVLSVVALFVLALTGVSFAKVSGPCVDCHTMHNSQNGTAMNSSGSLSTVYTNLLRSDCAGCHTGTFQSTVYPKVDKATSLLAGGSFNATVATTDAKKHNVPVVTAAQDGTLGLAAPGGAGNWTTRVTCAGQNGCHGDGTITNDTTNDPLGTAGINGFHHGTKLPTAYRFLADRGDNVRNVLGTAVPGIGSDNYEAGGATSTNHNLYSAGTNSISALCANCHGTFHGTADTGAAKPFVRHPTDYQIGLASSSTIGATVDYNNNPFAFQSPFTGLSTTSAYTTSNAYVACVSCHRAHGTAQDDILRFNYGTQIASGGATFGCLGCHTSQR